MQPCFWKFAGWGGVSLPHLAKITQDMLELKVDSSYYTKWVGKQWPGLKDFLVGVVGLEPSHFIDKNENPEGDHIPSESLPFHAVSIVCFKLSSAVGP